MRQRIVIGLGFGDEGKGKVVSHLCSKPQGKTPLVIRFSGGQQAGHHVVLKDGRDHVFSNFGSGTLQGVPTYWSPYCTMDPVGIMNERKVLAEKGITHPLLIIDVRSPVTTPYDKQVNRERERCNHHGSCGVGVGQTLQREADHFSLMAGDILYKPVFEAKLQMLARHYYKSVRVRGCEWDEFREAVELCRRFLLFEDGIPENFDEYIFEGSQGLLLDERIGFFPHVTRGHTDLTNIADGLWLGYETDIYLVTRAYQTRHGAGPMTGEDKRFGVRINPYEQNSDDTLQGDFRRAPLDLGLLQYGLRKAGIYPEKSTRARYHLVVTCVDDLEFVGGFPVVACNGLFTTFSKLHYFLEVIKNNLNIKSVLFSRTPFPEDMEVFSE